MEQAGKINVQKDKQEKLAEAQRVEAEKKKLEESKIETSKALEKKYADAPQKEIVLDYDTLNQKYPDIQYPAS